MIEKIDVIGSDMNQVIELIHYCHDQGWSDGLPVIPPVEELVNWMLTGTTRDPGEVICRIPPSWGEATIRRIAANAVMAGCLPEYMPVIIAALQASVDDRFNLHGIQCTTHNCSPLVIVNGAIAKKLGMNSGHNCFGQGNRANASIGRAVRLALVNIGGARPGELDKATQGHPGKFTYCIAENEEESPWEPYHVSRGFSPGESAVTVFGAEAPHNVNNQSSENAHDLLMTIADSLATLGSNNMYMMGECFIVLCPEHAKLIADHGFSRRNTQEFIFNYGRRTIADLSRGGVYGMEINKNLWPRWVDIRNVDTLIPPVRRPEDIQIVVAGGTGRHSAVIPGWGTRCVTKPVL